MTTWPTHRAKVRQRNQLDQYRRRQRMLGRRAARRAKAAPVQETPTRD